MTAENVLARVIGPVHGKPCWSVKCGYAAILTLEFGEPHLVVDEPVSYRGRSRRVQRALAHRVVQPAGQWRLWVEGNGWLIRQQDRMLANFESSSRRTAGAVRFLDGQVLVGLNVETTSGRSTFSFDLGGNLEIASDDPTDELWHVWDPTGNVLAIRARGMYSYAAGATPPEKVQWHPLTDIATDSILTPSEG